jgi:short-subunit dehydrogenase
MEQDKQRTALITGASTGIGYELSKIFARDGHGVILVARSEKKLREVEAEIRKSHSVPVTIIPSDLSAPGAAAELHRKVREQGLEIDFLINNAGVGLLGAFAEADETATMQMLQLNVVALTHLTRLFLPEMLRRKWGRILNVASTAAFQPGPLMAVYFASKAYVLHLSEALANEVEGSGVTVTALCPGATESEFAKTAKAEKSNLFQAKVMDAATVAEQGYRAMNRGRPVVVTGLINKLGVFSVRLGPRKMVTALSRKIMETS